MSRSSEYAFKSVYHRLIGERMRAFSILQNYFDNPVAIGEHPDLPEEIYKALADYTEADDKLKNLCVLLGFSPPELSLFATNNEHTTN